MTTQTVNVTTIAEFQSAVGTVGNLINVAAGTYTGDININADDIDIVMSNSATLVGIARSDTGSGTTYRSRIRWTGGTIDMNGRNPGAESLWWAGTRDILFDNVQILGLMHFLGKPTLGVGFKRVSFINSTIDIRGQAGPSYAVFMQQSVSYTEYHSDFIMCNCKLYTDHHTSIRNQQVDRAIFVECAFHCPQDSQNPMDTAFRIGEDSSEFFVGGRPEKRTQMVGRMYPGYIELLPSPPITNIRWDGIDHYNIANQAFQSSGFANTGTLSNYTPHFGTGSGQALDIAPFTVGSGVDNIQAWTQGAGPPYTSNWPSVSAYGADH